MQALSEADLKILATLQIDSRIPNAQLAEQVGLSTSACWRRVRALEEAGVIERYCIQIDPQKLGLEFHALVHVQLVRHNPDKMVEFIRAVEANPDIVECYATTGQADYHLRVQTRDIEAYNRFLETFCFANPQCRARRQMSYCARSSRGGDPECPTPFLQDYFFVEENTPSQSAPGGSAFKSAIRVWYMSISMVRSISSACAFGPTSLNMSSAVDQSCWR